MAQTDTTVGLDENRGNVRVAVKTHLGSLMPETGLGVSGIEDIVPVLCVIEGIVYECEILHPDARERSEELDLRF